MTFYSTAAEVIPVLLLAFLVEGRLLREGTDGGTSAEPGLGPILMAFFIFMACEGFAVAPLMLGLDTSLSRNLCMLGLLLAVVALFLSAVENWNDQMKRRATTHEAEKLTVCKKWAAWAAIMIAFVLCLLAGAVYRSQVVQTHQRDVSHRYMRTIATSASAMTRVARAMLRPSRSQAPPRSDQRVNRPH